MAESKVTITMTTREYRFLRTELEDLLVRLTAEITGKGLGEERTELKQREVSLQKLLSSI